MCSLLIDTFRKSFERGDGLEQLGGLLAAGFKSTHKVVINQMVEMWNATFGTEKTLTYPQALKATLQQLQPFVDLELPSFDIHASSTNRADTTTFIDSQDEDAQDRPESTEFSNSNSRSSEIQSLLPPSPWKSRAFGFPNVAPQLSQTSREPTAAAVSTRPKPRHDDSQVQYVAIESSPLQEVDSDSQYLTERQKEVRARRQAEPAVVFPDLRSSPLLRNDPLGPTRKKKLSLDLKQVEGFEDDAPATPSLGMLSNERRDEEMTSSPTPQSKQPVLCLDDIEVPSSPPSMPGASGFGAPTEPASSQVSAVQSAGLNSQIENRFLPPESCHDDTSQDPTGDSSPSVAEQPQELGPSDFDRKIETEGLADVELEEPFREGSSLLDAGGSNTDPAVPLASVVATDSPEMIIVDTSRDHQKRAEKKDVEGGIVMETIERPGDELIKQPTMPSRTEMQPEYAFQRPMLEGHNARTREGTNDDPQDIKKPIQQDMEMDGLLTLPRGDASLAEPEKRIQLDLLLQEDLSNSPAPGLRFTPELPVDYPANLNNSNAFSRNSPATSHGSHTDCDEVDILSASQLSQDLDWHVTLERRASQTERSPENEAKPVTRKRKSSGGYLATPKRRKAISSPTDESHLIFTPPSGTHCQAKRTEEVFDCIVLDTTPRPPHAPDQSSPLSQDAWITQKGGRKRGRKPKQRGITLPRQHFSPADSNSSSQPEVAVKVEGMPSKGESVFAEETAIAFLGSGAVESPPPAPSIANIPTALGSGEVADDPVEPSNLPITLPTNDAIHTTDSPVDVRGTESGPDKLDQAASTPGRHTLSPERDYPMQKSTTPATPPLEAGTPKERSGAVGSATEAAAEVDFIGSLQQVLNDLKSASMGRSTLREVEDLLFEIRTEAQHAVVRHVAGQ
jgi:hypothetical protein